MRFGKIGLFEVGVENLVFEFVFLMDFVLELFMERDDVVEFVMWFDLEFNLFLVELFVFFLGEVLKREFLILGVDCGVVFVVLECLNFFIKLFFRGLLDFVDGMYLEFCDVGLL